MDRDLTQLFVVESREMLEQLEPLVIELHKSAQASGSVDTEKLNTVFRLYHSLKGSAGFLDLQHMVEVAHEAETLLSRVAEEKLLLTAEHTRLLCETLDLLNAMLEKVDSTLSDREFAEPAKCLVTELRRSLDLSAPSSSLSSPPPSEAPSPPTVPTPISPKKEEEKSPVDDTIARRVLDRAQERGERLQNLLRDLVSNPTSTSAAYEAMSEFSALRDGCSLLGWESFVRLTERAGQIAGALAKGELSPLPENIELLVCVADTIREAVEAFRAGRPVPHEDVEGLLPYLEETLTILERPSTPFESGKPLSPSPATQPMPVGKAVHPEKKRPSLPSTLPRDIVPSQRKEESKAASGEPIATSKSPLPPSSARQDIRVDVEKLDTLLNLVGELVIAESMVTRNPALRGIKERGLQRAIHQLRRVSSDLQNIAMSLRMVPLTATFRRMIRLVHDVASKRSKQVELVLAGEETEVDKTVIEHITDPLVHLIRNAIDHGIESPDERIRLGKPPTGTIHLSAKHEGGDVIISIADDGQGLQVERIRNRAIERGLISADRAASLSDEQVYEFIFRPGFSTAEKVTDISGRGVGMDVVRQQIKSVNGRVAIRNQPGRGCTFILHIPLTLAIIDGMLIRVGEETFIVPVLSIRESFRPARGTISIAPDGQEMVRLRQEMLPVVRLHEILGMEGEEKRNERRLEDGILLVVEDARRVICLFADRILGQQEFVIKGLSPYLERVPGISGCSILGEGQVSLILDVPALMDMAGAASILPASA